MSDWSLSEIRTKVKTLCGDSSLDDDDLDEKINRIYRNVIPLEFILESLKTEISQTCTDEIGEYAIDADEYLKVGQPAEIDDLSSSNRVRLLFRTDRLGFFADYPELATAGTISTGVPTQILYSRNYIYPRPIPDDSYIIYLEGYKKPTALSEDDDAPVEQLWGPILACDVAREILIDNQDYDSLDGINAERKFYVSKLYAKEILQFENKRAEGRF